MADPSVSIILASASPQRAVLLARTGMRFEVIPSPRAEPRSKPATISVPAWAAALAYLKARAVADRNPQRWVLGADTLVECEGRMLGKPRDMEEARAMLALQAGRASSVVTGACLVRRYDGVARAVARLFSLVRTEVWMRTDDALIDEYIASGDWQGKAGAYGIQTVGDALVERIDGSFTNVVGLPLEAVRRLLARAAALNWNSCA